MKVADLRAGGLGIATGWRPDRPVTGSADINTPLTAGTPGRNIRKDQRTESVRSSRCKVTAADVGSGPGSPTPTSADLWRSEKAVQPPTYQLVTKRDRRHPPSVDALRAEMSLKLTCSRTRNFQKRYYSHVPTAWRRRPGIDHEASAMTEGFMRLIRTIRYRVRLPTARLPAAAGSPRRGRASAWT